MESSHDKTRLDVITLTLSVLKGLQRFYGQEIYSGIGGAVAASSRFNAFVFKLLALFRCSALANYAFLFSGVLFLRLYRYPKGGESIFQYGTSRNNVKAFSKLNQCLTQQQIACVSINGRPATALERLRALLAFRLMWQVSKVLARESHPDPYVHVQCLIGSAACVIYSVSPLPPTCRILCVANDHSPLPRALLAVCRARDVKTCYVQHAPVTEYFPPLSTDLSVLYDEKTVEAYRMAATREGAEFDPDSVVIMPPFGERFTRPEKWGNSVTVGVCLSKFPNIDNLKELLIGLCDMPCVDAVFLRPHPACKANFSSLHVNKKVVIQPGTECLADFTENVDVALVPTSGVAIELLHQGIPTFYTPEMDDIPYDYYGFVADGIVPVFDFGIFSNENNGLFFFDDSWLSRFSEYDVTVKRSLEECQRHVGFSFSEIFSSSESLK